jgi:nucleotide-binding universal stress UspA family protein
MFQHILLPTDGSQLSRDTAQRAVDFAKAANATITALYAKPDRESENYGNLVEPAVLDADGFGFRREGQGISRFHQEAVQGGRGRVYGAHGGQ